MSGNTLGTLFRVTNFGESHGPAIGAVIDGCPPGLSLSEADIQVELDRRRPGTSRHVTQRREPDTVEILSGVFEGQTTGTPIGLLIRNTDARSKDYSAIADTFRPAADRFHGQEGLAELGKRMHSKRGKAYDRALKALDSPRFLTLTLDLAAWLDSGARRDPAESPCEPIGRFAPAAMERLRRQIKRRGRGLTKLSPELRHKLRIRTKRLRYALEFFGDLYEHAPGRDRFVHTLKRLQDALGELNDLEVARQQGLSLAESGGRPAGDTAAEGARQAFAAGLMIGSRAQAQKPLLKKAERLLDRLLSDKPFWRD